MRDWIALNMTPGVGPRIAARLLEHFGSARAVFDAPRTELEDLGLSEETVTSIIARDQHERAERELASVRALGGDVLVLDDGAYPALLREIHDPPLALYVRGAWKECLEAPCIAMVGSRRCSTYGQNAATMLARDLAERGVTIISGLARGIDAASHRGALEANGRTVAVLGTGIDDVYPREHRKLVEEILAKGGSLVSEFPLGTPPMGQNFPYRNRIISGLSLGVLVVEAAENSGSLITARLALEQGREVFAVPGNITSRTSFGTNYLIKGAGAKLVQSWRDVVAELPAEIASAMLPEKKEGRQTAAQLTLDLSDLAESERAILNLLSPDEPAHIDALAQASKMAIADLNAALLNLELRDLIIQLPGRCFVRKL